MKLNISEFLPFPFYSFVSLQCLSSIPNNCAYFSMALKRTSSSKQAQWMFTPSYFSRRCSSFAASLLCEISSSINDILGIFLRRFPNILDMHNPLSVHHILADPRLVLVVISLSTALFFASSNASFAASPNFLADTWVGLPVWTTVCFTLSYTVA